ncbi:MAG: prepilin-type N-terminal cleavage/methylation domain-containing protein [Candidatus Gastranaerophilales bacterium]|nr:prepilin-type N-terminal cleavage/methylation domain-containing protein [Candidatus Gastranaerophilales bacterium]
MKKAFTLAEVLMTLVVIGLVAAMTIPTLMNNTNNEENKASLKKALSTLQQAIDMQYALDGVDITVSSGANGGENMYNNNNAFKKYMNVAKTELSSASTSNAYGADASGGLVMRMNDGSTITLSYGSAYIDTNGERGPNKVTTDYKNPKDGYSVNFGKKTSGNWPNEKYADRHSVIQSTMTASVLTGAKVTSRPSFESCFDDSSWCQ